ncbi:MAG TPA: hypothetical protein VF952_19500 [Chloroflexia bacterium]
MQCPGSQVTVAVAVSQMAPGWQVAVGEGQRPCPVVSTHIVAVAEGHPTAGFAHSVAVAVAGSQGSTGQRVSVGVAVKLPPGMMAPFAGSPATLLPWAVMPAATATVLSRAINITPASRRNWKYRLLYSGVRSLLFMSRPSFALPANEDLPGHNAVTPS